MNTSVKIALFLAIFLANGFTAYAQYTQSDDSTEYVGQSLMIFPVNTDYATSTPLEKITFKYTATVDKNTIVQIKNLNNNSTFFTSPAVIATTTATIENITYDLSGFDFNTLNEAGFLVSIIILGSTDNQMSFYGSGSFSSDVFFSPLGFTSPSGFHPAIETNIGSQPPPPPPPDPVYRLFNFRGIGNSGTFYTFVNIDVNNQLESDEFLVPPDTINNIYGICENVEPFIISNQTMLDFGYNPATYSDFFGEEALYCRTENVPTLSTSPPGSVISTGLPDGYYMIWDTGGEYYFFNKIGNTHTTFDPFSVEYQTRNTVEQVYESDKVVQILEPTYATTTATTSVLFSVNFQQLPTFDLVDDFTTRFEVRSATDDSLAFAWERDWVPQSLNFTQTELVELSEGSYIVTAFFQNEENSIISETDEVFFNVITNTYEQQTGLPFPTANAGDLSQNDCTTFDIGCQFQRAMVFLFYPSETVLNRFQSVWQTLRDIPPFGYVTATLDSLERLDNTATAAFSFGNIPFMSTIFTPLHGLISSILWALFAIWFFLHRLRHIEI